MGDHHTDPPNRLAEPDDSPAPLDGQSCAGDGVGTAGTGPDEEYEPL